MFAIVFAQWPYVLAMLCGGAIAWALMIYLRRRDEDLPADYPRSSVGAQQSRKELLRFRAALDIAGDSIYITDRATMKFVDVTATATERSGYSREELLNMGPIDFQKKTDPR